MALLHPLADTLNHTLSAKNPQLFSLLSKKGQRAYFPKLGILSQSADANGKAINATIGIALEDDKIPMHLSSIAAHITLPPAEVFPYATSYGKTGLRTQWQELIHTKNPTLTTPVSLPVVTAGITHALSVVGYLFLNPEDRIMLPAPYWDNYELIFEEAYEAVLQTFDVFQDGQFNLAGLEKALTESSGKQIVFLNFPQNPTGYTPLKSEMQTIVRLLLESAERGNTIAVMIDDAYFGLVYEDDVYPESVFAALANLHENILAIKIDGPTKEDYAWGLRIGFITYASKGLDAGSLKALEDKTAGVVRGTVSNCSQPAQSLLEHALKDPSYTPEKIQKTALLKSRYAEAKELATLPAYAGSFRMLPCNSGYFLCIELLHGLDAEPVRQTLLANHSTGIIAIGNLIRIAFSSVPSKDMPALFANIAAACTSSR